MISFLPGLCLVCAVWGKFFPSLDSGDEDNSMVEHAGRATYTNAEA